MDVGNLKCQKFQREFFDDAPQNARSIARVTESMKGLIIASTEIERSVGNVANEVEIKDAADDDSIEEGVDDSDTDNVGGMVQSSDGVTIAKDEIQEVRRYKLVVYAVLAIAAILFAVFVFVFIRNNETKDFEGAFYDHGKKVFKAIGSSIDRSLIPLDALTVILLSYAKAVNATWPFVTYPDYAELMSKMLPQTDGMIIQSIYVVQPEEKEEWELYASLNNQWVNESISFLEDWDHYYGYVGYEWTPHNMIFSDYGDIPPNVSRPMAPQWQQFPVSAQYYDPYNWDWLSQVNPQPFYAAMEGRKCVMQTPYFVGEPNDPVAQAEEQGWIDFYTDYIRPDEEPFEPALEITYPMINEVDDHNSSVVGFLSIGVYFREIIRDVLPLGSNGMIIVVDNKCAESFTYQIDGPNTTYLGMYDKHDRKYDQLTMSTLMADLSNASTDESLYTGVPINQEYCQYTLRLYPSKDMESMYTSNKATIFLLVTLCTFAILTILFIAYDSRVERRQRKVMSTAVRSTALVSSLFPASVQEQLYNTNTEKERAPATKNLFQRTASDENDAGIDSVENAGGGVGAAIATLYPETTVMFADIRGFTSWSALRQPNEVFHLLESIYGAFDTLAKSYGVFKVETIGDTYVAVCGLPVPKRNHAVAMTRFAKACLEKMTEVCHGLVDTLGPDTKDLAIRVGLNSGPTTAGVLRGEKARFQLFGDTVNTASRMESTGDVGKIHVTDSTAIALQQSGKEHWLTAREDKLEVKGKGVMSTYWCDPKSKSGSSVASSYRLSEDGDKMDITTTTSGTEPAATSPAPKFSSLLLEMEGQVPNDHHGDEIDAMMMVDEDEVDDMGVKPVEHV